MFRLVCLSVLAAVALANAIPKSNTQAINEFTEAINNKDEHALLAVSLELTLMAEWQWASSFT